MLDVLNREGRSLLLPLFGFVVLVFFVACVNVAGLFVARGPAAPSRIRDASRAWRIAIAAIPADDHRERRALDAQRDASAPDSRLASSPCSRRLAIAPSHERMMCRSAGRSWRSDLWQACSPPSCPACCLRLRAASPGHAHALEGRAQHDRPSGATVARVRSPPCKSCSPSALLTGAALLIRTSVKLASVNPGYEMDNIMAATVTTVTPNSFLPFHTQVLERVAALPGVSHAAFAWGVPLTGNKWPGNIEFIGRPGSRTGQLSAPLGHRRLFRVDGHADRRGPRVHRRRQERCAAGDDRQPVARQPLLLRRSAWTATAVRGRCEASVDDRRRRRRHAH